MPTIQLELSEEEYRRLETLSRARGQSLEALLRETLRSLLLKAASSVSEPPRAPKDTSKARAFLQLVEKYAGDDTPPVPLEAMRREILYRDEEP